MYVYIYIECIKWHRLVITLTKRNMRHFIKLMNCSLCNYTVFLELSDMMN